MKKKLSAALIAAIFSSVAAAGCITGQLHSTNKSLHFVGTAAISYSVAAATNNAAIGFWAGIAAGAARELYKVHKPGMRCEYSSMAYDLAGAAAGSYVAQRWLIVPRAGGVAVLYTRAF